MKYIQELFINPGTTSTMVYLCLATLVGLLAGKIEVKKIRLGVAGVLFSGLLIAHLVTHYLGASIDASLPILSFIRDFGLILFVYSIGIDMGPRFFSSFKKDGLTLNLLAIGIVFLSFLVMCIIYLVTDITPSAVVGILCGAVTNTPSLGAAQQALTENGMASSVAETGMAYAVAYPFGVIGIILTMLLLRLFFRIDVDKEVAGYNEMLGGSEAKLQSVEITVTNPSLFGKNVDYLMHIMDRELAVSRIYRNGKYILASDDEVIQPEDVIYGVSAENLIDNLKLKIGDVVVTDRGNIEGPMAVINVLVTNSKIAGKTIEQIGIYRRYPANITRIFRNGMKILPTLKTTLELGDTVKVVGEKKILKDVRKELGDSVKELAKPNIISVFLGILLGVLVGCIPIFIPGLPAPAKLGLAGGPLLVAILLGYKGRIKKMSFYMTPGANMFMKDLGIILFLACVGLLSGSNFVETFKTGGWTWMLYGVIITFLPIMLIGIIGRFLKINYLKICGTIAGSMTDPPALEFANSIAPVQAQSTAYATVYPLTMFLRVLLAQIFILVTLG